MALTKITSSVIEPGSIEASALELSGVTADTYGSASQVPVITVNQHGLITSVTNTAVAGVDDVSFNATTGVLTIDTSDGGSYSVDINTGTGDDPTFATVTTTGNITTEGNLYTGPSGYDGQVFAGTLFMNDAPLTFDINTFKLTISGDTVITASVADDSVILPGDIDVIGNIAVGGTVDGRDVATDGAKLDGIEAGATTDQTKADIDALGVDADTVDGLQASQFLRSDANDTATGAITFNDITTFNANINFDASGNAFSIDTDGYRNTFTFRRNGTAYWDLIHTSDANVLNFAPSQTATNNIQINGNRILTTADEGTGNGLDADTLDGQHGSYYTGYTDTAISNLLDGAPAALDTLNELAAAINDDASYAATITTALATKVAKAGDTMTGALSINSGSQKNHGFEINEAVATYRSDAPYWRLWQPNSTEQIAAVDNGEVRLSYDGTTKLTTTSGGIDVTGNIDLTGNIYLNNAADIRSADSVGANTRLLTMNSSNVTYVGPVDSYAGGGIVYGASSNATYHEMRVGGANRFITNSTTTVVNEAGADVDFRVESDANTHMLFVDANTSRVGIANNNPSYTLDVNGKLRTSQIVTLNAGGNTGSQAGAYYFKIGTLNISGSNSGELTIYGTQSYSAGSRVAGKTTVLIRGNNSTTSIEAYHHTQTSGNTGVYDICYVNTASNAFDIYAQLSTFHGFEVTYTGSGTFTSDIINTLSSTAPANSVDILGRFNIKFGDRHYLSMTEGAEAVFNQQAENLDFRVESVNNAQMLFVDSDLNRVNVGNGSGVNNCTLGVSGSIGFTGYTAGTYNDATGFVDHSGTNLRLHSGAAVGGSSSMALTTNIAGSVSEAITISDAIVINEQSVDRDFRVESDTNTHAFFLDASLGKVAINDNIPRGYLNVRGQGRDFSNGSLYDGYTDGLGGTGNPGVGVSTFYVYSDSTAAQDMGASIGFRAQSGNTLQDVTYGIIGAAKENSAVAGENAYSDQSKGYLSFHVSDTYNFSPEYGTRLRQRMKIGSTGALTTYPSSGGHAVFNEASSDADFRVESDGNSNMLLVDASSNYVFIGGTAVGSNVIAMDAGRILLDKTTDWNIESGGSTNGSHIRFRHSSADVGYITSTTSGTTYNTTSDRRLKENIEAITDGTDKLMAMRPVTHTWIADKDAPAVHGFIAQEMQEIIPEAVSGDPEGEEMMSMDYGRITPVIVAALQDALKEIEELKTRISQLEAK